MRPLTPEETRTLFTKLSLYIGRSVEQLITRTDEPHMFRLVKDRVYYLSAGLLKASSSISRDSIVSLGTCMGKFSKSGKFKLHITSLDYLAQHAKYKVWIKQSAELNFVYGNNVLKSGMARITDNTPQYSGVIVYSMNDLPLGFGVAAHATEHCKDLDPSQNVVLHQADIGEYLRVEEDLY